MPRIGPAWPIGGQRLFPFRFAHKEISDETCARLKIVPNDVPHLFKFMDASANLGYAVGENCIFAPESLSTCLSLAEQT